MLMTPYFKKNYDALAQAIILQAVADYRTALKMQKRHPDSRAALSEIREIEKFFHSSWFEVLTDVNPDYLLRRLKKEAGI